MNKQIAILGILLLAGVSFAVSREVPTGPAFNTLAQTCCQGEAAKYMVYTVYQQYFVWTGQGCDYPQMPYDWETLDMAFCDEEDGVWAYYMDMVETCHGQERSAACFNAYRQFYSRASAARGMFSATKTAYLSAARQALYAYQHELCQTVGPQTVNFNIAYSGNLYRECMQDPWDCIMDCQAVVEG